MTTPLSTTERTAATMSAHGFDLKMGKSGCVAEPFTPCGGLAA